MTQRLDSDKLSSEDEKSDDYNPSGAKPKHKKQGRHADSYSDDENPVLKSPVKKKRVVKEPGFYFLYTPV
jgi:hypothetical protein